MALPAPGPRSRVPERSSGGPRPRHQGAGPPSVASGPKVLGSPQPRITGPEIGGSGENSGIRVAGFRRQLAKEARDFAAPRILTTPSAALGGVSAKNGGHGRGRGLGSDPLTIRPISGRPATSEIRGSKFRDFGNESRGVCNFAAPQFSTWLSAATESEIPGLCELAGADLSWAICSHRGKFRFDRQIPDSAGIRKS